MSRPREIWAITGQGGALLVGLSGDVAAFETEALARAAIGRYRVVPPDPKVRLAVVRYVGPAPSTRKRRGCPHAEKGSTTLWCSICDRAAQARKRRRKKS